MWSASFLPILTMWALALLMELGPHKDRENSDRGGNWTHDLRVCMITAAPPTELQGQAGAGRADWRCQVHGNEYVQVHTTQPFLVLFTSHPGQSFSSVHEWA